MSKIQFFVEFPLFDRINYSLSKFQGAAVSCTTVGFEETKKMSYKFGYPYLGSL